MAPARDDESEAAVDDRPHIVTLDRKRRQGRRDVDDGKRVGCRFQRSAGRCDGGREPIENLKLERQRPLGGVGDLRFQFAEFGGGEADLTGERLPVNEGRVERRAHQLVAVLGGDVDEVTEHVVVADFQRTDAGGLGVADLKRGDDAAQLIAQCSRLVERRLVSGAHKAAVATERRQLFGQRPLKLNGKRSIGTAQRRHCLRHFMRDVCQRRNPLGNSRRGKNPIADGGEIARPAAADHDPRQGASEIGRRFQLFAQVGAPGGVIDKRCDRVKPVRDFARIGQRRGQSLRQQA